MIEIKLMVDERDYKTFGQIIRDETLAGIIFWNAEKRKYLFATAQDAAFDSEELMQLQTQLVALDHSEAERVANQKKYHG